PYSAPVFPYASLFRSSRGRAVSFGRGSACSEVPSAAWGEAVPGRCAGSRGAFPKDSPMKVSKTWPADSACVPFIDIRCPAGRERSEEHTSELQSRENL